MKTLDNIFLTGVLEQQAAPDSNMAVKEIRSSIGGWFIQMRDTAVRLKIDSLLNREMAEIDRNGQNGYSVSWLNVEREQ